MKKKHFWKFGQQYVDIYKRLGITKAQETIFVHSLFIDIKLYNQKYQILFAPANIYTVAK